ncbi:hypothetical protein B0H16DRAFT_1515811 [Mycena metata]|uniref:Uncharacterized protein n=1 Tax=Mycena metata TaxID=1033252 RepID=A0AAD7JS87_9AGAR|nr:hypothetical protein B0H16DRAFT_1515811 [Mycena metata]
MGGSQFCFKACDPANPDAQNYCEHKLDRIGCAYNAPNNAQNGTFEACLGDNQDFPGIYTENGAVMTYTQPPESLGPISTLPYQPKVPASSSCTAYPSTLLYGASASSTATGSSASGSGNGAARVTGSAASGSGASAGASATGTASGAEALRVGVVSGALGLLFAVVVFLS